MNWALTTKHIKCQINLQHLEDKINIKIIEIKW